MRCLHRLARPAVAAALLALAPAAKADTIDVFDVSGTLASSPSSFSGTLDIDVTKGTIKSADIKVAGYPKLTDIVGSGPERSGPYYTLDVENSDFDTLSLLFSTRPTAKSLVGFTGGQIAATTGSNLILPGGDLRITVDVKGGRITRDPPVAPLPSSWSLMLIGVAGFGLLASRGKRNPAAARSVCA